MRSSLKRVTHLFTAIVLAGGLALGTGCAKSEQAAPVEPAESVTVTVIGPDANGDDVYYAAPTEVDLASVEDAWGATQKVFDDNELTYDAENSSYGVMLNSITSPADGSVLAFDEGAGTYWQLFVDGEASEVGIDGVELADGMQIVWYYSAFGDALPEGELAVVEPLANAA